MAALVSFVAAGPIVLAEAIVFHVANRCPFPVWPASAPNTGHPVLAGGGFYVPPGKSRRVVAPATWNGRFWARTGCNFTADNGLGGGTGCVTGDCECRLACNGSVGAPPATLVEVSLHEDPAKGSSFDVSLVDGYNLPVAVSAKTAADPANKCAIAGCAKNVNAVCPQELQVTAMEDGGGGKTVVACKSACLAFGLDAFCCRGAYATPATCRGSVYSRLFKDACPAYYSYAYDTTAATASGCNAQEYVITFCPSRWGEEPDDRAAQI